MTVVTEPSVMQTYKRWPVMFVSGKGARLVDERGDEYIDLVAGVAVTSLGHGHPRLAAAIADQAGTLIHASNLYSNPYQDELADKLASVMHGYLSFFCNSGAESVECAIKLARKWAGSHDKSATIVCADGGFHGRTLGALSATGQPSKKAAFEPLVPGFSHVAYGDVDAAERALSDGAAAVLVEPIQGEAGVVVPPGGYLAQLRDACDAAGALLIFDEVQTGVGRTGRFFAAEWDNVVPDIVCLAKGLASGLPIGACLANRSVASAFVPGDHATTFGGGPLVCRAACVVVDEVTRDGFLERVVDAGETLRSGLQELWPASTVRGRGLLLGLDLGAPVAHDVAEVAFDRKLLLNEITDSVVRIAPPLVIDDDEIDAALAILEEVRDAVG